MKKLILIDGHHLIFRAFYAINDLRMRNGTPSNAIFGFASMILNIIALEMPYYLAIAFDCGKTFRHEEHKGYKGTRKERPEDLDIQIPIILEMVKKMGIPQFSVNGFEADDILGTISVNESKSDDIESIIVTGDRDLLQIVNDRIKVSIPHKGGREPIYMDTDAVFKKYGITPNQIIDYKGIVGDTSDNIKGINGIGPKTASKLLNKYKTLENIYENINEMEGSLKTKLEQDKKQAFFAKRLATIITNVPLNYSLSDLSFNGISNDILQMFEEMDFNSLKVRVKKYIKEIKPLVEDLDKDYVKQLSLF